MIDSREGRSHRDRRSGTRAWKEIGSQQESKPGRPRMQHFGAAAGQFLMACFILPGLAGSSRSPTPAEIVSTRFPLADIGSSVVPVSLSTTSVLPIERWKLSSPTALQATTSAAMPATAESSVQLAPEQLPQPVAPIGTPKPEPSRAQSSNAAAVRAASRLGGVLNDAQIASIKQRLNLTPEQETMWSAVEAALRRITYTKNAMSPRAAQSSGERIAYIDPTSPEVQQLKYAVLPLMKRLSDDQRREVKMMTHVMGLENVASQF
jgi:hypothetical protein